MDHTDVVRDKTTERYLLNELSPDIRDEFEEHYFDCPECAQDVSAAAQFVKHSKSVLAEKTETVSLPTTADRGVARGPWSFWFRPAFAAPALALLLAIVGYQNFVTYPRLRSELRQPQILPAVSVNLGTYGARETSVPEGKGLLLFVRIPPDPIFARYTGELYNPAGKPEGSFTIDPAAGQDQWPVTVPAVSREAGTYTLAVHGVTATGETKDLGSTSFELQIRETQNSK
ncbi:MAG TPA: zf-HC2 domain-containing protein [Candidatus Sulfotelmatobacter sp.]|jgi:hypothetical protein